MSTPPYVVVGAGMAGGRAAEYLALRGRPAGGVVLIGAEPERPYHRPVLSKQLLGEGDTDTEPYFRPPEFYPRRGVTLRLGERAGGVDLAAREVVLESGERVPYERLVLAPGTTPRRLPVPGADLAGVHYLRTLADAGRIRDALPGSTRVVVVGGGFIGTEVAMACVRRGLDVVLVELAPTVLAAALGAEVGSLLQQRLQRRGVAVRTSSRVESFTGVGAVSGVVLQGGQRLPADLVVVGVGVRPDLGWLTDSGLAVRDGIVVDEFCATSDPAVYAAGDAARWHHEWFGELRLEHETNAQNQAMAAARNALGGRHLYRPTPYVWSDQGDLRLRYVGHCTRWDELVVHGGAEGPLSVAYLRDGRVHAVLAVDDSAGYQEADRLLQVAGPFPAAAWPRVRSSA